MRLGRSSASMAAAFTMVVAGLLVATTVVVIRTTVLRAETYTSALAETEAYDRLYTEVLADPELAAVVEGLLGDLGVAPELAVQSRSMVTNVLRWVVPPSTVRAGTESAINSALAYVRGESSRVSAELVVTDITAQIPSAAVREVRSLLAGAAEDTVASMPELEAALYEFSDQLADGVVPAEIPVLGGTQFDPEEVAAAILDALGERADDEVRDLVMAALLAGDQRSAIIAAVGRTVAEHGAEAATRLGDEPTIDLVAIVAERSEQPVAAVVDTFDTARDIAAWTRPLVGLVGALVALAGGVWLVRAGRRAGRSGPLLLAAALATTAGLVALVYLVVAGLVGSPLEPATSTGPDSWNLPVAVRYLIGDLEDEVVARLRGVLWRSVGMLALAGAVLAAAVLVPGRVRHRHLRLAVAVAVGVVALVGLGVLTSTAPHEEVACNGHVELCDRPYDEVVYAATHNSMSTPEVVQVWPEHDGGLTVQLDAGVRGLLIDTHHWLPVDSAARLAEAVPVGELPLPAGVAEALYDAVVDVRGGRPGAFLCHNHCAFGGQPLVEGLEEVRRFLDDNPHEVVTLIVQDQISPAETEVAFREADLLKYVHSQRPGRPWPTLGELVERDERLVVFAENAGPPPSWYGSAFDAMQETPYFFPTPESFNCDENRGPADATLFQLNHWVQRAAPDRADAVTVNRLDVLVARAEECARQRGRMPNYLAVNFFNIGDVVAAADVLNGFP